MAHYLENSEALHEQSGGLPEILMNIDEQLWKSFLQNMSRIIPGVFLNMKNIETRSKHTISDGQTSICWFIWDPFRMIGRP